MKNLFTLPAHLTNCDHSYTVSVQFSHYRYDNGLAVLLMTEANEPFAIISVCLVDYPTTEPDTFFADTNNCPWASDFLINNGIAKLTGRTGFSGFCEYPQFKLTPEWKEIADKVVD